MSLLLNIETSTTNCSVALSKNGKLVALKEDDNAGYSHAENLHVFIDQLIKDNNYSLEDLDAVVVSKGPGSYTGLRIGVSTAKGLCYALDIPLIAVNTLNSLALSYKSDKTCFIVPMLDARRMEVYTATYNENHEEQSATKALVLEENSFLENLNAQQTVFIGNGVNKFSEVCKHQNAVFINQTPSAKDVCKHAFDKYNNKDFEDVAYFEPYYLKDFVVTQKKKKQLPSS